MKVVLNWSHSFIRRHMKQKYLKKVEDIRLAHRDITNYFLQAFIESKPLVEIPRNIQIRLFQLMKSFFRSFVRLSEEIKDVDSFSNNRYSIPKQRIIIDD